MSFDEVFAQRVSNVAVKNHYIPVTMVMAKPWPPMCIARLWAYDVVISMVHVSINCELEYILDKFRKNLGIQEHFNHWFKEHEYIDYRSPYENGYIDVRACNKTLLQLFYK